jgi:uncharacterized protein YecE (DUF72 family)
MLDLSQGVDKDLMRLVDLMAPLAGGGELGRLLIQLPPSFGYGLGRLEAFFRIMPKGQH